MAANAGTYLAPSVIHLAIGDSVHRTPTSMGIEGKQLAKLMAAQDAGISKPGPKITSATRSGLDVTGNIAHVGTLADGTGGTGAGLLGFRLFDSGIVGADKSAAFTMSGIVGSTVLMVLGSEPLGTLTMDFGMANLPFGSSTPAAAAVLYDNDIVPGHTLGLALQPCAAITVS